MATNSRGRAAHTSKSQETTTTQMEATPSPRQLLSPQARRGHQLIPDSTPCFKRALISLAVDCPCDQRRRSPVTFPGPKTCKKDDLSSHQLTPGLGDEPRQRWVRRAVGWPVETGDLFLPMAPTRAFSHDRGRSAFLDPLVARVGSRMVAFPNKPEVVSHWVRSGRSQQTIPASLALHRGPGSPPQRRSVSWWPRRSISSAVQQRSRRRCLLAGTRSLDRALHGSPGTYGRIKTDSGRPCGNTSKTRRG
ncbi:hypothetical protein QBC39DRAFT_364157 [Podospora conica]|nr:hypothetical protein QBC39DRAFT_364157 [Schizothecium conicum]